MKESFMLIIGIVMFVGFVVYKIYKITKYSVKVELEIDRYSEENVQADRFYHRSVPIYKYSYKGMIYKYNNGKTKKKYIRINPDNPSKAYLPHMTVAYLFFNFIILVIGIGIYFINRFY